MDIDDIITELQGIGDNKLKGTLFERFALEFLRCEQCWHETVEDVWLINDLPLSEQNYLNITNRDNGVDMIMKMASGEYIAVQVKFRSNLARALNFDELSTFLAHAAVKDNKISRFLVFTTAPGVTERLDVDWIFVGYHSLLQLDRDLVETLWNAAKADRPSVPLPRFTPHPYQAEIVSKISSFRGPRGQVYMPCGTGKTLVAYWAMQARGHGRVCVLVPSLHLISQTMRVWRRMGYMGVWPWWRAARIAIPWCKRVNPTCYSQRIPRKSENSSFWEVSMSSYVPTILVTLCEISRDLSMPSSSTRRITPRDHVALSCQFRSR